MAAATTAVTDVTSSSACGSEVDETGEKVVIDGNNLTTDQLLRLGKPGVSIVLSAESQRSVREARDVIDEILEKQLTVYGINTGFGAFADRIISEDSLETLQHNLIKSHAAGVGQPLSVELTRMTFALRINVLAKGYSGVSPETLQQYVDAFNASCLSKIPEKGTVGACGDLAPMSHIALGLMGIGEMWSPETGWKDAASVLENHNLKPLKLKPKEGLALINGAQFITALGARAIEAAILVARQADVIAALSIDALKGSARAFDADIHRLRPHSGQILVASRLRALLHNKLFPSEIYLSHRYCGKVQDAYSLRCCPQVHGVAHDTIDFVRKIIETEMNSVTDNPIVLPHRRETISGGNFHGEYPAKALDYLAIGIHEIGSISERRIERLINPAYSNMPAFLAKVGGLNSGLMIPHCTAAALVSENKALCHPSSVDSLSTSANTEDHVSMGGWAARKCLQVIDNVAYILAVELIAACQAMEFHNSMKTTAPLEEVRRLTRSVSPAIDVDRYIAPDIENVANLIKSGKVWTAVESYIRQFEDLEKSGQSTEVQDPKCHSHH